MTTNRRTAEGAAIEALFFDIARAFHRLRAAGQRTGAVSEHGRGTFGLLRSLDRQGPQSVPDLARQRPVSRQHIQKMVDELAADGIVELFDNPRHRRSRLVRLTAKGKALHDRLREAVRDEAEVLAREFGLPDLETTSAVLRKIADAV